MPVHRQRQTRSLCLALQQYTLSPVGGTVNAADERTDFRLCQTPEPPERVAVHALGEARAIAHGSHATIRMDYDVLREHPITRTVVKSRIRE